MTSQEKLIKQIQFPKIVLPVAANTAGVVGFAFGLIPLFAIMLLYAHRISPFLVLIPVIAAVQYLFTLGVAFLVSAVNVFFRDLGNVLRHVLRLWFYLSPGLYSLTLLDQTAIFQQNPILSFIAHANPMAILFEAYRAVIYGTPEGAPMFPDWGGLLALTIASSILIAPDGDLLQAPRAAVREGPVSSLPASSTDAAAPSAAAEAAAPPPMDDTGRGRWPSRPPTSASATACASPRRRPSASRWARSCRASRWNRSGRCATCPSMSSVASRWRSSAPTGRARARSCRCWPGSSCRRRARSRSTATSRAC